MNETDYLADLAQAKRRRRRRKLLLFGGIPLVLVLLLGGYVGYMSWSSNRDWREAVAEVDQSDPNWRWDDLQAQRGAVADEENGALVVIAVKKLLPKPWPAWDWPIPEPGQLYGPDLAGLGGLDMEIQGPPVNLESLQAHRDEQEKARMELQNSFGEMEAPVQLSGVQLKALREELPKAAEALAEARKLVKYPKGRHPIQYAPDFISTLMPTIQETREVINLLNLDALLRTQEGDLAGALESCHAMLNASRSLGDEPMLIPMLVRIACRTVALRRIERVLAHGEAADADLARLQRLLQEDEKEPLFLNAIRGERAGSDRLTEALESGQYNWKQMQGLLGGPGDSGWETVRLLIPGGMRGQRASLLRVTTRAVEMAKLPLEQQHERAAQMEREAPQLPLLARLLTPAVVKCVSAYLRSVAEVRCMQVVLAAERYRLAQGRWPEQLDALVPEYLPQVPLDPFDGKPLRWRRVEDGFVVYSVSTDGSDNGGKLLRNWNATGADYGCRLYDVPQRRQPHRSPKPRDGDD